MSSSRVDNVDLSILTDAARAPRVGSVQRMYPLTAGREEYWLSEAPDSGSVFDVGSVFTIPDSGIYRQTLRHRIFTRLMDPAAWERLGDSDFKVCFSNQARVDALRQSRTFQRLSRQGALTHHRGLVHPVTGEVVAGETDMWSPLVLMVSYPVVKPVRADIAGTPVYDYREYSEASKKVLALEHIVRLGNPGGSSLQSRYNRLAKKSPSDAQAFLSEFGTAPPLEAWSRLPDAAVEWSTKYEGYDRYLSRQEALLISGVSAARLNEAVDLLLLCTVQVNAFVASTNLQLWDLKWELAINGDHEIVVVDTVDHDSMRLTLAIHHDVAGPCVVHFNKQAVRDYYKIFHADWHAALDDAKRQSDLPGGDAFKDIYRAGVRSGAYPESPGIEAGFADIQSRKYKLVTDGPGADPSLSGQLAAEEVDYYIGRGRLEDFLRFNAVPEDAASLSQP